MELLGRLFSAANPDAALAARRRKDTAAAPRPWVPRAEAAELASTMGRTP